MADPILASIADHPRTMEILGERVPMEAHALGGLHKIGEQAPYFSITLAAHRKGFPNARWQGGANHEAIRELFGDRFDDLIALHLASQDGTPMHAVGNGAYDLFGYFGGMGQRYHRGNSKLHMPRHPRDIDPARPWEATEYREPTRLECLAMFAKLWRISTDEARVIATDCRSRAGDNGERFKARLAEHAAAFKPVWKMHADVAIANHGLTVYGDKRRG